MRTTLPFIGALLAVTCLAAACQGEAPGTGDTTQAVTAPAQPEQGAKAPVDAATTNTNTLQLVTAGAPAPYLGDNAGRALYYMEGDTDGSKCTGDCIRAWPPFLATDAMPSGSANLQPGMIGVIERADGGRQISYNRHPLYHYAADTSADRAAGNGIHDQWGQWHAVDAVGGPLPMTAQSNAGQGDGAASESTGNAPAKSEPAKTDPTKTETAQTEPAKQ